MQDVWNESGLDKRIFNNVLLSISESVCNAIVHGNRCDSQKKVFINFAFSGEELTIQVEDEGEGFDERTLPDPTRPDNIKRESGRGIFLIRKLSDEMRFDQDGRRISIKFNINREHQFF